MAAIIKIKNLNVSYQNNQALHNISLELPKGIRGCIVGPNGAGKSTLIKAIMGLVTFQASEIKVFNQPISNIRDSVAYVPQKSEVNWNFPTTVYDTVLMGISAKRFGLSPIPKKLQKTAEAALNHVQLLDLRDRPINQLSGGQKQRVFIARAIAQNASLYFFDEPLAGVDINSEEIIMTQLKEFQTEGRTSITVHHDLTTVPNYFDYVIMINQKLITHGPIEKVFTEENIKQTYSSPDRHMNESIGSD